MSTPELLTRELLLEVLNKLPEPKKYPYDAIKIPIFKAKCVVVSESYASVEPVAFIEEITFIKTLDGRDWKLREITYGGSSVSFRDSPSEHSIVRKFERFY